MRMIVNQEAHGPHCSLKNRFLINKIEQSYDYTNTWVNSYFYLPSGKCVALHLNNLIIFAENKFLKLTLLMHFPYITIISP